ncbi:DUF6340 family protein [Pontibacter rugosus]|uniref:DUF6340 family protein n=1 Tax=Pontibacter rugosus TaxID=1745966 RepID=A0ABW3STA0_9BACT
MSKRIIAFVLYCLLVQTACTSQLFIDSLKPAEVSITNEQWKVVVLNRYNPELLSFNKEKKIAVFAAGAQEAFYGAVDAIQQDETYELVYADTSNYRVTTTEEPLTANQVRELHARHPYHLLLSLDHFTTFLDQETERYEEENGDVSKTAHYTLIARSSWSLHDSTGAVLDKITLEQSKHYQSRPVFSGLLAIGPSMANAGPDVNDLAWLTGNDYWLRLSPQPRTFARSYYSSKKLQQAAYSMATKEWDKAISLLLPLAEGSHKKDAARAAYNLAVVYEAKGNIEEAKFWAKEAIKRNDKLAPMLLPELEQNY